MPSVARRTVCASAHRLLSPTRASLARGRRRHACKLTRHAGHASWIGSAGCGTRRRRRNPRRNPGLSTLSFATAMLPGPRSPHADSRSRGESRASRLSRTERVLDRALSRSLRVRRWMALRVRGFRFLQCMRTFPGSRRHACRPGRDHGPRGDRSLATRTELLEKLRDVLTRLILCPPDVRYRLCWPVTYSRAPKPRLNELRAELELTNDTSRTM